MIDTPTMERTELFKCNLNQKNTIAIEKITRPKSNVNSWRIYGKRIVKVTNSAWSPTSEVSCSSKFSLAARRYVSSSLAWVVVSSVTFLQRYVSFLMGPPFQKVDLMQLIVMFSGLTYLSKADLMKVISQNGDFMNSVNFALISSWVAVSRSRLPGIPFGPRMEEREEDTMELSQIGVSSGCKGFLARQNFQ